MTAASALTIRTGPGWSARIDGDRMVLTVDYKDEKALPDFLADLDSWSSSYAWSGYYLGDDRNGFEIWDFEYDG